MIGWSLSFDWYAVTPLFSAFGDQKGGLYHEYPTFYYKTEIELPVRYFSGKTAGRTAFVYIMHEERPLGLPSGSYVRICLEGYSNFGFDESILLAALNNSRRAVHEIR